MTKETRENVVERKG